MKHPTVKLNGNFGILIEHVTRNDLTDPNFQSEAYNLWMKHGGLLAVRGSELFEISPTEFMDWSRAFGEIEEAIQTAREDKCVPNFPILRIGNIKDSSGKPIAQFSLVPQLTNDCQIQYNPESRRPVWHTDSTFRRNPPIGSSFHCRQAPPSGSETLFADTRSAFDELEEEKKLFLKGLEAVCSLAHHDKKINSYSPEYPVLTVEQRNANPPNRVPVVLKHPITGRLALYGLNSSTCAIIPVGDKFSASDLDVWDLKGIEDKSVMIWRDLLPFVTSPTFTVKWQWQPGDIVVWDNRSTIHAATGFDHQQHKREMWRLTLLDEGQNEGGSMTGN